MAAKKSSAKSKAAKSAKPAKVTKKAVHKPVAKKAVRKPVAKHTATRSESKGDYSKFSGKFTVRLPKSLHQALVDRAEREGVSLNLFVTNALSRTVAAPKGK